MWYAVACHRIGQPWCSPVAVPTQRRGCQISTRSSSALRHVPTQRSITAFTSAPVIWRVRPECRHRPARSVTRQGWHSPVHLASIV